MTYTQPQAIEAERMLLGAIMIYPQALEKVKETGLQSSHFYQKNHQDLFRAFEEVYRQEHYVDLTTTITYLKEIKALDQIGSTQYLLELSQDISPLSSLPYYCSLIIDKAQLRQMISTSIEIGKIAQSGQEINEILDESERLLLEVTRNRRTNDFEEGGVVAKRVYDHIVTLSSGESATTGLRTGYSRLDKITHGFQRGDLIILAARPSVGKTALALNFGLEVAIRNDASVALFSLEMPADHLVERMLASRSLVQSDKLRTGYGITNDNWNALNEAVFDLEKAKIYIDDSSMIKMSEIFSKCRKLKADHGLDLVIIDYIQLISSGGHYENRQQEVSQISRQLKMLARELECPVIALSQLTRAVEQANREPQLSDLRESGAIEQDADIVFMLHREQTLDDDVPNSVRPENQLINLFIRKHRNGSIGEVQLNFMGSYSKFLDMDN
ncbi:MAG: replicative DNA helicase [Erysipelothrix sp.]|nr:replicative DNA helicase [Erysipelothrix sp.]